MSLQVEKLRAQLQRIEDRVESTESTVDSVDYRLERLESTIGKLFSMLEDEPESPEEESTSD